LVKPSHRSIVPVGIVSTNAPRLAIYEGGQQWKTWPTVYSTLPYPASDRHAQRSPIGCQTNISKRIALGVQPKHSVTD